MLTTLDSLRTRLSLTVTDYDDILTQFLLAAGAHFEKKCNRKFAQGEDFQEFPADQTEIIAARYPVRTVVSFELKSNESEGWFAVLDIERLVRNGCVISIPSPLGTWRQQARVTYIGGYFLPDDPDYPGSDPLPDDIQQAAIEQVAAWFLHRDYPGLIRHWPHGGVYQMFSQLPLLPQVETVLESYKRWSI